MAKKEQAGKKAGTGAPKVLKSGSTGKDSKVSRRIGAQQRPDKSRK